MHRLECAPVHLCTRAQAGRIVSDDELGPPKVLLSRLPALVFRDVPSSSDPFQLRWLAFSVLLTTTMRARSLTECLKAD
jgi:hypothetical protein